MKRSNRLVLLIGIFLAIVAFVGIVLIFQGNQSTGPAAPSQLPTVFAKANIPLGTQVTADMLEVQNLNVTQRDATAFQDPSLVVGKIIRRDVVSGTQLVAADFARSSAVSEITVPRGLRAIAVQVDQLSGVGTVISSGDYVDMVVGLTGDKFPVITINPQTNQPAPVTGINATSVKLLLQGMQVVGTLLPPPPQQAQATQQPATGQQPTALTGQQEIVILAVTAQQAEVIKFAQMDGSISLVLRSPKDFRDPKDPTKPFTPAPDVTSGIILKTLVDEYGVLTPQLVETILPTKK